MEDKLIKIETSDNFIICKNCKIAKTFDERLLGLMFKSDMNDYDGLLIRPCNSIHTFFMRFNIDVVFLTKDFKVVKIIKNISPWKITWIYFKAFQVLELKGGTLDSTIVEGQILRAHV